LVRIEQAAAAKGPKPEDLSRQKEDDQGDPEEEAGERVAGARSFPK
jgi:hypothetical protein